MGFNVLKVIHRLFNISFNISENLLDLAILVQHFRYQNTAYLISSIIFYFLPNIIVLLCSTFHFLHTCNKSKHALLSMLLVSSNLDVILPNILLIGYESRSKTNDKNLILDLLDIKFILLISNCFHILFNNYPFSIVQFNYMITHSNIPRDMAVLLITKILISIVKINLYSVKLVWHFLQNEFGLNVPKIFPMVRFMTNFLYFTSKVFVYSIAYLFAPNIVIILLATKYLASFFIYYRFIGFNNSLEAFWSFFWAMCDQICFVHDFSFSTNFTRLRLLFNLSEFLFLSILNLTFEFKNLELASPKLFLLLVIVSFLMSYCLEFCYWCLNPIWTGNRRNESIFMDRIKEWLRNQSTGTSHECLIDSEDGQQIYLISERDCLSN